MASVASLVASEAADKLKVALGNCPERRIDELIKLAYSGLHSGVFDEPTLGGVVRIGEVRRDLFAARRRVASYRKPYAPAVLPTDRRSKARRRRRVWAGSGPLPHHLRSYFTHGENAVAGVVCAEVRKFGRCTLSWGAIAKAAGLLSTTVVKRFIRLARKMKLIDVEERRRKGAPNDTSVITVVSDDWQRWIDGPPPGKDRKNRGHADTPIQNGYAKTSLSTVLDPLKRMPAQAPQGAWERGSVPAMAALRRSSG